MAGIVVCAALLLSSCEGSGSGEDARGVPPVDVTDADSAPDAVLDVGRQSEVEPEVETDVVTVPWAEPVPMTVVDGLPMIDGSVGDSPVYPFLIDTIAQVCFADDELVGDFLYHELDATFGNETVELMLIKGRDMSLDEKYLGLDIGGLIGQFYIMKHFLVLDYPAGQFRAMPGPPDLAGDPLPGHEGEEPEVIEILLQNAFPIITAEIGAGNQVPLLADTTSRITVVTQSVFEAIDTGELPQVTGYVYESKYGFEEAFLTRLPSVRFGDLEVADLEAVVIPDDHHLKAVLEPNAVFVEGFLGAAFWSRFVLGIDAMGGTEFDPQLYLLWGDGSEPIGWQGRWTKAGVELTWVEEEIVVEMVYGGSSAELAGVEPGDLLLSVDGVETIGVALEEVRAMLTGEAGVSLSLGLQKADGTTPFVDVEIEVILP